MRAAQLRHTRTNGGGAAACFTTATHTATHMAHHERGGQAPRCWSTRTSLQHVRCPWHLRQCQRRCAAASSSRTCRTCHHSTRTACGAGKSQTRHHSQRTLQQRPPTRCLPCRYCKQVQTTTSRHHKCERNATVPPAYPHKKHGRSHIAARSPARTSCVRCHRLVVRAPSRRYRACPAARHAAMPALPTH